MTHTYQRARGEDLWVVGYWEPDRYDDGAQSYSWRTIEDFADEEDARRLVNYLNGGSGALFPRK